MDPDRRYDLFAVGLIGTVTLFGLFLWPELPSKMAIHWSGGTPDSFVSKSLAIFGLFAFGIGTVIFVRIAPPSLTNTPGGPNITVLFIGVVLTWVQSLVLVWNLGYKFNMGLAVLPVLVLAGLLAVYAHLGNPLH